MLCWSGVAPVQQQSGKSKVVQWRWARPKFLHQTFVEYARSSVMFCGWAREFFDSRVKKGWSRFRIYRALAFKWIRIFWRCWMDDVPYDEAKYSAGLQKRGVKLYASHLCRARRQRAKEQLKKMANLCLTEYLRGLG